MDPSELVGRRFPAPPRPTERGVLVAYGLVGLAIASLWAVSYPVVAMLFVAGGVIGTAGTILVLVVTIRKQHRPICLHRLRICLTPAHRDRYSERL